MNLLKDDKKTPTEETATQTTTQVTTEVTTEATTQEAPVKRGRGRPKGTTGTPITRAVTGEDLDKNEMKRGYETKGTGKRTWSPYNNMSTVQKEPGFRYRYSTEASIDKKKHEGWEIVKRAYNPAYEGRFLSDGTAMSSCETRGKLVLMRITEERALLRDEYYRNRNNEAVSAGVRTFKKSANEAGIATYKTKQSNV